jgi:formylglycine-generating enzyme required for sulfatase activity
MPEDWASEWGEDRFGPFMGFSVGKVVQRMRWVPPGSFVMGSPESEDGRFDNEGPQHLVELSQGFWLADTPCTQDLWHAVMGENPSHFSKVTSRPVEQVSWDDCQIFCSKLETLVPGLGARLPTEAEWEYACRGDTTGATWVGELDLQGSKARLLEPVAWYEGNTEGSTHQVGQKQINPFGLHDMLGNVWEWCADWYGPYGARAVVDPDGSATGSGRVIRGGSWLNHARGVRAACRRRYSAGYRYDILGFRFARRRAPSQRTGAPTLPAKVTRR